ncbi:hypothetical protein M2396_003462 [Pseudomonas sp. BIGb0278]|nr:hypothetical protein [Pseudomonas sp. BIGb0278]
MSSATLQALLLAEPDEIPEPVLAIRYWQA